MPSIGLPRDRVHVRSTIIDALAPTPIGIFLVPSATTVRQDLLDDVVWTETVRLLVNASLKFPENQRFEIVGFVALLGRILWFDPRREHSSIPTANSRSRRAQGLSRLAASSRPPAGLGLDWPEHGGILNRIGA